MKLLKTALQNKEKENLFLLSEAIRAGAALGDYREDLELKKLFTSSPEFKKYKSMEECKLIISHDFNTNEETDKFWKKY